MAVALSAAAAARTSARAARTARASLTLQQAVGQRVIGSLPGTTVPPELAAKIRRGELGGVILFARNVASRAQLKALTDRLQAERRRGPRALRDLPLLVMIDQEGGLVKRLPGAPQLSPVQVAARNSADLARRTGVATASNLTGVGVNVNLAPVLDLGLPGSSVLELGRTYGSTPAQVSRLGVAFASGLRAGGVLATAKHFPGLGRGGHDEDLKLNRIDVPLATLRATDEVPFRAAASAGVPLTMVSTGVYPALDSRPAMFSPRIVQKSCARSSASTARSSPTTSRCRRSRTSRPSARRSPRCAPATTCCSSARPPRRPIAVPPRSCAPSDPARSRARPSMTALSGRFPCGRRCADSPGLLYFSVPMPKMKTHSGAKKRFKVTAKGKVRGRHAFSSHILEKKSPKRKRALGRPAIMSDDDAPRIKKLLGVGK